MNCRVKDYSSFDVVVSVEKFGGYLKLAARTSAVKRGKGERAE